MTTKNLIKMLNQLDPHGKMYINIYDNEQGDWFPLQKDEICIKNNEIILGWIDGNE